MQNKKETKVQSIFAKPLEVSKPRTDAEIQEAFNQGRIAEMGDEETSSKLKDLPKEILEKIERANKYFDENPPKAQSQEELDKFFKRS